MPYYIGDVIQDSGKLTARTVEKFREGGIDARICSRVDGIDGEAHEVHLADGSRVPYDILTLATGTEVLLPGIPGEDREGVFVLKSLGDALHIKSYIEQTGCRKALIVGAGFIGLEVCENLRERGVAVQIVNRGDLPAHRWDPQFGREILKTMISRGVDFFPRVSILSIEGGSDYRLRLNTDQGPFEGDLILLAMGVKPHVALARQMGIALGDSGAIRVNLSQRTSQANVYAVGDCAESFHRVSRRWVSIPLGDIANKQGRIAGSVIGGVPRVFPGIVGAQSFRIFHLEVAATGLDEREAAASGFDPVSALLWGNASANAMSQPRRLGLKLIADRASGLLLGAQAVGEAGAVGRINTLSAALWAGLSLDDVYNLDLAYSPPYGGSWDLIHNAARTLLQQI